MRLPRAVVRRELLAPALAAARRSRGLLARLVALTLSRTLLLGWERLPVTAITWPLLPTNLIMPVMLVDAALLDAALMPGPAGEAARQRLRQVLIHEAAHHCGVVWPEWRNWVNTLARRLLCFVKWRDRRFPVFPYERIYGVGVNSADTLAARIIEEASSR